MGSPGWFLSAIGTVYCVYLAFTGVVAGSPSSLTLIRVTWVLRDPLPSRPSLIVTPENGPINGFMGEIIPPLSTGHRQRCRLQRSEEGDSTGCDNEDTAMVSEYHVQQVAAKHRVELTDEGNNTTTHNIAALLLGHWPIYLAGTMAPRGRHSSATRLAAGSFVKMRQFGRLKAIQTAQENEEKGNDGFNIKKKEEKAKK
ncbi:hypothetical protein BZA05DRAFT_442035 [Tricharina praecox]|uniref:uncharacterized protein n=1 Tax=Tricharina praecox TaxID=43433 RepID=UPI002220250E|nr:uncharacterized protein BZA05DRAFT_442035 [Tricharina praecox]KAI5856341.1 hypothetical protein BZA05DRAFT_442035 [Tricharina praecox]